ncbi:MAG: T9SS type A sorting domain-containing protein [Flavobacteriales bacterium]
MKRIGYLIMFLLISASSQATGLTIDTAATSACSGESILIKASGYDSITYESSATLSADTGDSVYATGSAGIHLVIIKGYNSGSSTVQDSVAFSIEFFADHFMTVTGSVAMSSPGCGVDTIYIDKCLDGSAFWFTVSGMDEYLWASGTLAIDSVHSDSVNIIQVADTHQIRLTGKDTATNDEDTIYLSIIIKPRPSYTLVNTAALDNGFICLGKSATFTVTTDGSNTIGWAPNIDLDTNAGSVVIATPDTIRTYTLTVTDMYGCIATKAEQIQIGKLKPVISITASASEVCPGDSTTLAGSAPQGITRWEWSPAGSLNSNSKATVRAAPMVTTKYTVVGTLLGCKDTNDVTINVLPIPDMTYFQSSGGAPIALDQEDSIVVTCADCKSYYWKLPSSQLYTTSNVQIVSPNTPGDHIINVRGIDSNSCSNSLSITVKVDSTWVGDPWPPLAIEEDVVEGIQISQRSGAILISSVENIQSAQLYNLLGEQIVNQSNVNANNHKIETSQFAEGVYIVVVKSNSETISQKIFIR